jgi:hypothetical protein
MGKKNVEATKLSDIDTDDSENSDETNILASILNTKRTNPKEYSTLKFVMFATAIFAVLSLPFTDKLLELSLPLAQSWLVLLGLKSVIFFLLFYVVFYMNK